MSVATWRVHILNKEEESAVWVHNHTVFSGTHGYPINWHVYNSLQQHTHAYTEHRNINYHLWVMCNFTFSITRLYDKAMVLSRNLIKCCSHRTLSQVVNVPDCSTCSMLAWRIVKPISILSDASSWNSNPGSITDRDI